jgi:hypothetical protein
MILVHIFIVLVIIVILTLIIGGCIVVYGEGSEYVKNIKHENWIIWNPLKVGFLVYKDIPINRRVNTIHPVELITYSIGAFIIQFLVFKGKKDKVSNSEKLYMKLYNKYVNNGG